MEVLRIYLAGGMGNLSYKEQTEWRIKFQNAIKKNSYDTDKKVEIFSPPNYYNFEETRYRTEREVMSFDLYNLRKSDLVVVNFNDCHSIGTAMELMCSKENRILVIGLNEKKVKLHPWLECCCLRMCNSMEEVVDFVTEFFLK